MKNPRDYGYKPPAALTPRDRNLWLKAAELAARQGHTGDRVYITQLFVQLKKSRRVRHDEAIAFATDALKRVEDTDRKTINLTHVHIVDKLVADGWLRSQANALVDAVWESITQAPQQNPQIQLFTKPVLPRQNPDTAPNPSADLPLSPRVVENYQRFHGTDPDRVDSKKLWVPGELVLIGHGVDVGYDVTNKKSEKDGYYVHDFGAAVEIYRRARPGEQADVIIYNFPVELTVVGNALGFTYTTDDGHKQEVKLGRRKLAYTPDCKRLVVVGASGVEFVLYGGKMRVTDWIYD